MSVRLYNYSSTQLIQLYIETNNLSLIPYRARAIIRGVKVNKRKTKNK